MDAAGNLYLGTGNDGKLFRVSPDGKGSILYKASELGCDCPRDRR